MRRITLGIVVAAFVLAGGLFLALREERPAAEAPRVPVFAPGPTGPHAPVMLPEATSSPEFLAAEGDADAVPLTGEAWQGGTVRLALVAQSVAPDPRRMPLDALDEVVWRDVPLDASGRPDLAGMLAEPSWVQASSPGWRSDVVLAQPGAPVQLSLRAVGVLAGRVLAEDGTPLPGAWVALHADTRGKFKPRWHFGDTPLDRRAPALPRDARTVVADPDGAFSLPHEPGFVIAHHPDGWPVVAFPDPGGSTLTLPTGCTLEGRVVDAFGRPPRGAPPLSVKVWPGQVKQTVHRPMTFQWVELDPTFRFRVRGLEPGHVSTRLYAGDGVALDYRGANFDAAGRGQVTLRYAPPASVSVHVPESHELLARLELQRVVPPGEAESSIKQVVLKRGDEPDTWRLDVPWRGETAVMAFPHSAGTLDLGRVLIDEDVERFAFELALPDGRLRVSVVTVAQAHPVTVKIGRVEDGHRPFAEGVIQQPGEEALLTRLPAGQWRLWAEPSQDSELAVQCQVLACARVTLDADADESITLVDDSRLIDVTVVDAGGRLCGDIAVGCDSEAEPFGFIAFRHTDERGRCPLRVFGPGPFSLWAYDMNDSSRKSGIVRGVRAEDGPLTLVLQQVATVQFVVPERLGPRPVLLRVDGGNGAADFGAELDIEVGRCYPVQLPVGRATVEFVDAGGMTLGRQVVTIEGPGERTVVVEP